MSTNRLDFARQMQAVPVRNQHVRVLGDAAPDRLCLEIDLRYTGWRGLLARGLKPSRVRRYELSGLGRDVYDSVDGVATFERLTDAFASRHRLTFLEARSLLMQFLQTLMARGLIVMVVAPTRPDSARSARSLR
jgi:hypothetical protein